MKTRLDRVRKMWLQFEASTLQGCPKMQRDEMRKAFYMGAYTLLNHLSNDIDDETSEEDGAEIFQSVLDECTQFFEGL